MTDTVHVEGDQGRCALSGPLGFASVDEVWRALRSGGWLGSAERVDLSRVSDCDSAGLALLVAWRAARTGAGGSLHFEAVPERLVALARLTGAESLLEA